jgi:hypothetical protein
MALNSNTELSLINTNINAGTITLPASLDNQGRVVTFKDILETFNRNTLTLLCSGSDTFEDNGTSKVLKEQYGSIQVVASGTKWYILNGTQVDTLQTVNFNVNAISSITISTINTTISSLTFLDNFNSTTTLYTTISSVSTQAVSTNFLYYNNFIIGGTRVGYSNVLNSSRFSLFSLPGLSLWLDSADTTTTILSGANVTRWNDKSASGFNAFSPAGSNPTLRSAGLNGLNTITFNGTSQFFTFSNANALDFNLNDFAIFAVAELILNNVTKNIISKNSPALPQWRLAMENNQVQSLVFNVVGGLSISFGTPSAGWGILSGMTYRGTGNVLFINGTPSGAGSVIGGSLTNGVSASIGAGFTGTYSRFWDRDIAEIIVFNASLTPFQRQQVEGYLAWKWGLQSRLPASHPFRNAPPS